MDVLERGDRDKSNETGIKEGPRGDRDKDNETGLKERGGIEMSTTVVHSRTAPSLLYFTYLLIFSFLGLVLIRV